MRFYHVKCILQSSKKAKFSKKTLDADRSTAFSPTSIYSLPATLFSQVTHALAK